VVCVIPANEERSLKDLKRTPTKVKDFLTVKRGYFHVYKEFKIHEAYRIHSGNRAEKT